jgi:lipoate-protein ligase A
MNTTKELNEGLRKIASWAQRRAKGDHDNISTLMGLERMMRELRYAMRDDIVTHTKYSVIEINVETDKDMPSEDVDEFIQEFLDDLKINTTLWSPEGAMHLTASVPHEEPTP